MNYGGFERTVAAALGDVTAANLVPLEDARRAWRAVRARTTYRAADGTRRRLKGAPAFLTAGENVGKLSLQGGDGRLIVGHALAPAASSGVADVCPFAGECRSGCVATAGNGGFPRTVAVRRARTRLWAEDPAAAFSLMVHELRAYVARGVPFAVRLNTFSDVRWERVLPAWFWREFDGVTFYDYTKHPLRSRPAESMPANYSLTWSWSERGTAAELTRALEARRNVAAVVSTRGGHVPGTDAKRPIPAELWGRPTIDGDVHDRRYSDPSGVVVVLRRKGSLAASSPFVVSV